MILRPLIPSLACLACCAATLHADSLTKQAEIDFGRDVASRNLVGLATRSDGRIVPGPAFTDLAGSALADILWCLQPAGDGRFLVGTGPDGKIFEVTFGAPAPGAPASDAFTARLLGHVEETQVFSLLRLPDGGVLAGTSPAGSLYLFRDGKAVSRVVLPVDSVFAFLALPDGAVLAATGNPGNLYRIDPAKFAAAGVSSTRVSDAKALADKGVSLFGEIRDRNVRRLALLPSGRVVAGSAPKGNIYSFAAAGGAPIVVLENHDTEVVDLLPLPDGSFYAAFVSTGGAEDKRLGTRTPAAAAPADAAPPPAFAGRSSLAYFPAGGFPEVVAARSNVAFYRLALHEGCVLITAGEQGDLFGYDPVSRSSLVYAGSASAQLTELLPLDGARFLALRNNAAGLALIDFAAAGPRSLETRRLDLGSPTELGLLRFPRLRGLDASALAVQARMSNGSDEIEGWSAWTSLEARDGAFFASGQRGRYLRLKLTLADAGVAAPGAGVPAPAFEIDKAQLYHLPQNRRPQLTEFRILPPGLGLVPAAEPAQPAVVSLNQFLSPSQGDSGDKRRASFLNSQVVQTPYNRVVLWNMTDPDGDSLAYTFSVRAENTERWIDLAVDSHDSYVQFDASAFADGLYLTRLTVSEQAPRPAAQRLTYTFETDLLVVDRTPPEIVTATVERTAGGATVRVAGRDALSLLYGVELNFNNGFKETVEHPVDGILDSREETFSLEVPPARLSGATSVEVLLYDAAGNSTARRLSLP